MRNTTSYLMIALILLTPFAALADRVLVIEGNTALLVDTDKGTAVRLSVDKIITATTGEVTDPVNPPAKGSLTEWVTNRTKQVPQHKWREETATGLAAAYLGLAKVWREGKVKEVNQLLDDRKDLHDSLTGALGVGDKWKAFDDDLVAELTRRKIKPANIAESLEEVAAGLTQGKAINPAVIAAGIKLVMAMLSKDKAAVKQAIAELVLALISGIG